MTKERSLDNFGQCLFEKLTLCALKTIRPMRVEIGPQSVNDVLAPTEKSFSGKQPRSFAFKKKRKKITFIIISYYFTFFTYCYFILFISLIPRQNRKQ